MRAVLGNNDRSLFGVLPETRLDDIGGVRVGMVHDSGPGPGGRGACGGRSPTPTW